MATWAQTPPAARVHDRGCFECGAAGVGQLNAAFQSRGAEIMQAAQRRGVAVCVCVANHCEWKYGDPDGVALWRASHWHRNQGGPFGDDWRREVYGGVHPHFAAGIETLCRFLRRWDSHLIVEAVNEGEGTVEWTREVVRLIHAAGVTRVLTSGTDVSESEYHSAHSRVWPHGAPRRLDSTDGTDHPDLDRMVAAIMHARAHGQHWEIDGAFDDDKGNWPRFREACVRAHATLGVG